MFPYAGRLATYCPRKGSLYLWALAVFISVSLACAIINYLHHIPPVLGQILENLTVDASADDHEAVRSYAYAFAALAGAMAFLFTIPFQLIRVWHNERNTQSSEQGLVTDRINKAVEGLGAEKTVKRLLNHTDADSKEEKKSEEVTEPNIEVRIGAIYSLERISQDSDRDHITIMKILCAYIRENAPATAAKPFPLPDWPALPEGVTLEQPTTRDIADARAKAIRDWAKQLRTSHPPRIDIQTALDVIGRRGQDRIRLERPTRKCGGRPYKLDLRYTNLQAANLSDLDFAHAKLTGAELQGVVLWRAKLQGVDGRKAKLQGAKLSDAALQGAILSEAKLPAAYLEGAHLQGANLASADLQGARLGQAGLQGANLTSADLQGARLGEAKLQGAVLRGARLQGAYLRQAQSQGAVLSGARLQGADLRQAQLQDANLAHAWFQRADFGEVRLDITTYFQPASLRGSAWQHVDLSKLDLDIALFKDTFGDASVKPPAGWGNARPAGWESEREPNDDIFRERWDTFLAALGDDPAAPN